MCVLSHNEFSVGSRLDASAEDVWASVTTAAGVNAELMPIVRMTVPRGLEDLSLEDAVPGERLGRSWILLFGLIPIDYDDITLVEVEPGRGFLERSPMLTQRRWEHERRLEPDGAGCTVTDRVRFEPRLPVPVALLRPVFHAVFRHRHRRLRRRFGGQPLRRLSE
jgi:ligand-binding SRPBCC domain-containing protein